MLKRHPAISTPTPNNLEEMEVLRWQRKLGIRDWVNNGWKVAVRHKLHRDLSLSESSRVREKNDFLGIWKDW